MSVHFRGKEVQNDVGGNKKQPNNNALYTMIPHLLKGSKKQFWPWWWWCWFGLRMIFEFELCAHNHATLKLWHLANNIKPNPFNLARTHAILLPTWYLHIWINDKSFAQKMTLKHTVCSFIKSPH